MCPLTVLVPGRPAFCSPVSVEWITIDWLISFALLSSSPPAWLLPLLWSLSLWISATLQALGNENNRAEVNLVL